MIGVFSGWNVPEILIDGLNQSVRDVNMIEPSLTRADEELLF